MTTIELVIETLTMLIRSDPNPNRSRTHPSCEPVPDVRPIHDLSNSISRPPSLSRFDRLRLPGVTLTPSSTPKPTPTPTPTLTLLRIGSDGAIAELEIEGFADVMINGCDLLHALTEGNSRPRHNHKLLDEVKFSHRILSGLRRKRIIVSRYYQVVALGTIVNGPSTSPCTYCKQPYALPTNEPTGHPMVSSTSNRIAPLRRKKPRRFNHFKLNNTVSYSIIT